MGFESLLGNQRLKDNLTAGLRQGKSAHFYLISGPKGSGKGKLAKLLAAAVLCQGAEKPCTRCLSCRKVLENVHPDVISVTDSEHKTVPVRLIRQMRDDVFVRPNEGERKVYIFPQELGVEGQNALLKILEEPPSYGVFLLLTENPEKILPTVRSRCVELALQPLDGGLLRRTLQKEFPNAATAALDAAAQRSGGFLGQARLLLTEGQTDAPQTLDFVRAYGEKDPYLLTCTLVPMEKWKREQLIEILQSWTEILEGAMAARAGEAPLLKLSAELAARRSPRELNEAVSVLQKAQLYAQGNVSPAAICGYLEWALR